MSQLKNIKINTPTYREIIPSTNTEVKITPFKVGDEKILLIASESKDPKQMIDSLKKVIDNCVQGAELKDMSAFDVEYLFLKIRSDSVGETADIFLTCKECETANECKIDLSKIEVRGLDSFKTKIKITDDLMFSMLTPDLDSYTGVENNAEGIIEFIAKNVDKVFYGEETIDIGTNDKQDVIDIINQLTSTQFKDLQDYISGMPKVTYELDFECKHCQTKNDVKLEGLADFF
jgi:hypothetical protein